MVANNFPNVVNGQPVDADAWFNAVAKALTAVQNIATPLGLIGQTRRTSNSTGITTTDTPVDGFTFTPAAGRRYRVVWSGGGESTVALDTYRISLRWILGASLIVTGSTTIVQRVPSATVANRHQPFTLYEDNVIGLPTSQLTIGISCVRVLGTGTITLAAATDNETALFVEDIGAV